METALLRGEVYWVDFDPSVGGDIQKMRPAIVISNDEANAVLNRVQVIPLTSQTNRLYPGETLVQLRGRTSKAMADQLTTVSKRRIGSRIGSLAVTEMEAVELSVLLQLGITRN